MLILLWLSCEQEAAERPRFCVRRLEACDGPEPVLLEGCPSGEQSGGCRMDAPLLAVCPETPGGCAPVGDWLQTAGWFDDPELFIVHDCQSRDDGARERWITVLWFGELDRTLAPGDTIWRTWKLSFDQRSGSMLGAEYEQIGNASTGWCCSTRGTNTQIWGEFIDPNGEGDCHEIQPGWPGW